LIPVAIARHPSQAVPLQDSWFGKAHDYLGTSVGTTVHKLGDVFDPSVGFSRSFNSDFASVLNSRHLSDRN
jgi:hypothetical protein